MNYGTEMGQILICKPKYHRLPAIPYIQIYKSWVRITPPYVERDISLSQFNTIILCCVCKFTTQIISLIIFKGNFILSKTGMGNL